MSTTAIKWLALVLMLVDHLGEFFPQSVPLWFRFAQRLFFLFGAGNHQLTRAVIIDRIDLRKLSAQLLHLLL